MAYFVATEKLPIAKYPRICHLESLHGVDVGTTYFNDVACRTFCHYIAQSKHQSLIDKLSKAKFFSLLLDGSTDRSNVDNIIFLAVYCDYSARDEKVHSRMPFLKVDHPASGTGEGLFASLESVLQCLRIPSIDAEVCRKLVGVGTDGASANIVARGLKALVESKLQWICWM